MKRLALTIIALAVCAVGMAQHQPKDPPKHHPHGVNITDKIPDLSDAQRDQIDIITSRSSKTIKFYRNQLNAVRDSIRSYMDITTDMSSTVFPLYEREGMLQTELSKEYYRTKVAIDAVLTTEQIKKLHEAMKKEKNAPVEKKISQKQKK